MARDVSAWLRAQREGHGWTTSEMARQLIAAGRARGDRQLPGLDGMCHNVYRWERGGTISERYKLHYCQAFGIPPAQFATGSGPRPAAGPATAEIATAPATASGPGLPVTYGGWPVSGRCPRSSPRRPARVSFRRLPWG
jgi:hypothetical protein